MVEWDPRNPTRSRIPRGATSARRDAPSWPSTKPARRLPRRGHRKSPGLPTSSNAETPSHDVRPVRVRGPFHFPAADEESVFGGEGKGPRSGRTTNETSQQSLGTCALPHNLRPTTDHQQANPFQEDVDVRLLGFLAGQVPRERDRAPLNPPHKPLLHQFAQHGVVLIVAIDNRLRVRRFERLV